MIETKVMTDRAETLFPRLNCAYNTVFKPDRLSVGLVVPVEAYPQTAEPFMERHLERAQMAESLGFAALWVRDVPFNVPTFGDTGQMFDPFVYLGLLAGLTQDIALGTASIILPLRHPAHVAKAAASIDQLSSGRLLLGVASGDRPEEYPALAMDFPDRGERFRESLRYIRSMADAYPQFDGSHGTLSGSMDMLPKPVAERIPILITGGSQQNPEWVAAHGDAWMTYPRDPALQGRLVSEYRARTVEGGQTAKPVMQSLYVDVLPDKNSQPHPIHLGFQSGVSFLRDYLKALQEIGVNHVALNLRFNQAPIGETLERLAEGLLPTFPTKGISQ